MSRVIRGIVPRSRATLVSASSHEHGDHVEAPLLIELPLSRDRSIEDRHLDELAVRRACSAGTVGDGRHATIERGIGDRSVTLGRGAGFQGCTLPVGQGQGLEPLEALLGKERGSCFTLADLDAAGRLLESGDDTDQTDREHQDRHQYFAQGEALLVAHGIPHRTLTRPVAATTTVLVAESPEFVTV
jgi:hypothetical protein